MINLHYRAKEKIGVWIKRMDKEVLNALPLFKLGAPIKIVDTLPGLQAALIEIYANYDVVGIDTESKPAWIRGVKHDIALIQIATQGTVYLIRTNIIGFPEILWDFLVDTEILKVGIGLKDDKQRLRRRREDFNPDAWLDLSEVAKSGGIITIGLRNLVGLFLNKRLSKKQQLSNWERYKLTPAQQHYAALDAWAPLVIFWTIKAELQII